MFSAVGAAYKKSISRGKGLFAIYLASLLLIPMSPLLAANEPDLIVFNGKIAVVDEAMTFAQAMAISGDTIIKVGSNNEVLALAGPQTQKLDVSGRTVIPAIVDPHRHMTGFRAQDFPEARGIRLPPSQDKVEIKKGILEAIKKAVSEKKPGEWIIVNPAGVAARQMILYGEITRAEMDQVSPNHPVMLNESGSSGANSQILFNSKGRAIIEKEFGAFAKFSDNDIQEDGVNLSGMVVKDIILKGRDKDYAPSIKKYLMSSLLPQGIVAVGTRILRTPLNALFILDKQGEMPIRFGWFFSDGSYYNPEGFYKRFPNMAGVGSKYLWGIGNGEEVTESPTTGPCMTIPWRNPALIEHYKKAELNLCRLENPVIRNTIKDQIQYGRGVEYHGAGDKTIDLLLGIVEEIQRETGMTDEQIREKRLTMEHLNTVRMDQMPRLKKYGFIMANTPNYFMRQLDKSMPANIAQNLGEQYLKWHQPAKSFLDNGIRTVMSEIGYPFEALQLYVTREACFTPRLPEQGDVGVEKCAKLAPEQAVDRNTALKMATRWPAYYLLRENDMGSLEAGKLADFIVLDQDYFTIPEKEIGKTQVLLTAIGGKVVFADPKFGSVDKALFKSQEYIDLKRPSQEGGM
ncbi:MAG: amidohydrolase family protein [Acidobacteria bacterium]|nr:amidohydrolase family protein [Acidobacteriota bacterium]